MDERILVFLGCYYITHKLACKDTIRITFNELPSKSDATLFCCVSFNAEIILALSHDPTNEDYYYQLIYNLNVIYISNLKR